MSHLRRFAKHNQIPEHLHPLLLREGSSPAQTIFVLISPPLPDIDSLQNVLSPFAPPDLLAGNKLVFHTVRIPLQPPLTTVQAEAWSNTMWPVVFNPSAPRAMIAPPPHILSRTRDFIQPKAGRYLALAQRVAEEAEQSGLGRGVGAVVVDPDLEAQLDDEEGADIHWSDAVVAVAGDGRYSRTTLPEPGPNPMRQTYNPDYEGGPELHALMRVVELIASKRREDRPGSSSTGRPCLNYLETYFLSQSDVIRSDDDDSKDPSPVPEKYQKTETSSHAIYKQPEAAEDDTPTMARIRPRSQGGYLCTDLDVYLTHEPCICCCMGLLLSRFRAVIYPRNGRMVSGGLASEPVVKPVPVEEETSAAEIQEPTPDDTPHQREYYGLHWRKELNWRALGFEFVEEVEKSAEGVAFHA